MQDLYRKPYGFKVFRCSGSNTALPFYMGSPSYSRIIGKKGTLIIKGLLGNLGIMELGSGL